MPKVNFSGAEVNVGKPPAPGWQSSTLVFAEDTVAKSSGNDMVEWHFQINAGDDTGKEVREYSTWDHEFPRSRLVQLLIAIDDDLEEEDFGPESSIDFDPIDYVESSVDLFLVHEPYVDEKTGENKISARIDRFRPVF